MSSVGSSAVFFFFFIFFNVLKLLRAFKAVIVGGGQMEMALAFVLFFNFLHFYFIYFYYFLFFFLLLMTFTLFTFLMKVQARLVAIFLACIFLHTLSNAEFLLFLLLFDFASWSHLFLFVQDGRIYGLGFILLFLLLFDVVIHCNLQVFFIFLSFTTLFSAVFFSFLLYIAWSLEFYLKYVGLFRDIYAILSF